MLLDEYRRSMMMMQQRLGWQSTLAMMLVVVVVGLCNGCVCEDSRIDSIGGLSLLRRGRRQRRAR